jgi:hypothetical protein
VENRGVRGLQRVDGLNLGVDIGEGNRDRGKHGVDRRHDDGLRASELHSEHVLGDSGRGGDVAESRLLVAATQADVEADLDQPFPIVARAHCRTVAALPRRWLASSYWARESDPSGGVA